MSVTALVVNYNAGALLTDCIASLVNNGIRDIRVVDNASTDGSLATLVGRYGRSSGVEVLANPTNRGFGPAINDQLDTVSGSKLLIINPDCCLAPGALTLLTAALDHDAGAALAGPRVTDRQGRREPAACRRFPTPRLAFMTASGLSRLAGRFPGLAGVEVHEHTAPPQVAAVEATSGACMLVRTELLRTLGGFDEAYHLHCEDLDLMFRLREAGWRVLYVPQASAMHVQGVSSASRPLWVHRQKHRGLSRFFRQHIAHGVGWPQQALFTLGLWTHWLALWPLQWLRRA
ncbi:MAG: glycosyltransferase family 2 protein [Pseudomonadota bacterium]